MMKKLLANEEYCLYESVSSYDDYELLSWLQQNGIMFHQDWKHIDEQEIYAFINKRSCALKTQPLPINEAKMTEWVNSMFFHSNSQLVKSLLFQYDTLIRKIGLRIINRQTYSDCYNLFIVTSENASKLCVIKSDFWNFIRL